MVNQHKERTILGVPIDCSGRAIGVERMPEALRAAGLVERLAAHDAGNLPVTIDDPRRDPVTGLIGFNAVWSTSIAISDAVGDRMRHGDRPLVVGGDCTFLIGGFAVLKNHFGRVGLAFIDGHLNFYDGRSSPTGQAADMELAFLVDIGPRGLIDLAGSALLVAFCCSSVRVPGRWILCVTTGSAMLVPKSRACIYLGQREYTRSA